MPASPIVAWLWNFLVEFKAAAFSGTFKIPKWVGGAFAVLTALLGQQIRGSVAYNTGAGKIGMTDTQFVAGLLIVLWVFACAGYAVARALPSRVAFAGVVNKDASDVGEMHCRVRVENVSGREVRQCSVTLVKTDPPIHNLPISLHRMHASRPAGPVDLAPGGAALYDVVGAHPGQMTLTIKGVGHEPVLPFRDHRITLRLTAADSAPVDRDFIIKPSTYGPTIEEVEPV